MVENVAAEKTWDALIADPQAVLVDVRTDAEWTYVGIADLSEAGKRAVLVPWQTFPSGQRNGQFLDQLRAAGVEPAAKVFFLCRSGGRSMAAAQAAEAVGYAQCYNVVDGFEGPQDASGHRGTTAGWKAAGLPWQQG